MAHWSHDAVLYHLYPLGSLGAPARNDFAAPPAPRLAALEGWLDYWQDLGVDALYLGPVFEATAHGYDTADYFAVDRRLGTEATLARFGEALHHRGMRLVLDAVFHHVGRDFWAFKDVLARGPASPWRDWFHLDFGGARSPHGDPFRYEGWNGHYDLVKLDVGNAAVREHLFEAVASWVRRFGIDGLRLDAADSLDLDFQRALAAHCRARWPGFWLMGEVIHGDYRRWANPEALASATNYEVYKGLWSSFNDANLFEIAHSLDRQFGPRGIYRGLRLYTFLDNHDVDRVASRLADPAHLEAAHALLFAAPGIPSIYYGSEWGLEGRKTDGSDAPLRPTLETPAAMAGQAPRPDLFPAVRRLVEARRRCAALRHGDYEQLHVAPEQLAFRRNAGRECAIVAVNAAGGGVEVRLRLPDLPRTGLVDLLGAGERFATDEGGAVTLALPARGARILSVDR